MVFLQVRVVYNIHASLPAIATTIHGEWIYINGGDQLVCYLCFSHSDNTVFVQHLFVTIIYSDFLLLQQHVEVFGFRCNSSGPH